MEISYKFVPSIEVSKRDGHYYIGDKIASMRGGHPFLSATDRNWDLPEDLRDKVAEVQVTHYRHLTIPSMRRRVGTYHVRRGTGNEEVIVATGFVEDSVASGQILQRIEIIAATKAEALHLLDLIIAGDIVPDVDGEAPQVVMPTPDPDRLASVVKSADDLAMILLERAMRRLSTCVTSG